MTCARSIRGGDTLQNIKVKVKLYKSISSGKKSNFNLVRHGVKKEKNPETFYMIFFGSKIFCQDLPEPVVVGGIIFFFLTDLHSQTTSGSQKVYCVGISLYIPSHNKEQKM